MPPRKVVNEPREWAGVWEPGVRLPSHLVGRGVERVLVDGEEWLVVDDVVTARVAPGE